MMVGLAESPPRAAAARRALGPFLDDVVAFVAGSDTAVCVVGRADGRVRWLDDGTASLLGVRPPLSVWELVDARAERLLRRSLGARRGADRLLLGLVDASGRGWPTELRLAFADDRFLLLGTHLDAGARDAAAARRTAELVHAARVEERRRIERDVHDGAQQKFLAVALGLELAAARAGDAALAARLDGLRLHLDDALAELRDVIRSPYPRSLAVVGLAATLRRATATSPVPVHVVDHDVGRYPRRLERVVYYACVEGVQNAVKHARASRIDVELEERHGTLRFRVRDDGRGFARPARGRSGSGLPGLRERLRDAGGTLRVVSAPGRGTTLAGSVPVDARHAASGSRRSSTLPSSTSTGTP